MEYKSQLDKIYKAIDEIKHNSEFSGWHDIADNIIAKVNKLESMLRNNNHIHHDNSDLEELLVLLKSIKNKEE